MKEGLTWLVAAMIGVGFILTTYFWGHIPIPLLFIFGGILVCWHAHLQHEILHGHPTKNDRMNTLLGLPSLWLWLPYGIYRDSHLAHHRADPLTHPINDPESFYVTLDVWQSAPGWYRSVLKFNQTLAGRLLLGPLLMVGRFYRSEIGRLSSGDFSHLKHWLPHIVVSGGLLYWVSVLCGMPIWIYLLCFVWPGSALALLRSYAEHWPTENAEERTAMVRSPGFFSLLFLNNNLHALHHDRPGMAWYHLADRDREDPFAFPQAPQFNGYGALVWQYLFHMKDHPLANVH